MALPMSFERRVAWRFLVEGRTQSLLILLGVAAGVAVVAFITALVTGLQGNTLSKTLGAQAHITLYSPYDTVIPAAPAASGVHALQTTQPRAQRTRSLSNWQLLLPLLEAEPGVAAVSPMVAGAGLAQRGEATQSIALSGIELPRYDRIVGLRSKLVSGQPTLEPGDAIIGTQLAADLGIAVGDRLSVLVGNGSTSTRETLRVTALADLGIRELNRRTVLVPLRTAQSLLGLPGGASSLDVSLVDPWQAQALADSFAQRWPYRVESWQASNAQLVSALHAQTVSTTLIRVVVLLVVVLGIASVLVVSVVQKQREIGILRAMGATRAQMLRVFLLQGLWVSALGSAAGVLLAALLVKAFVTFVRGSDGQPLFVLRVDPATALQVAAVATLCGVLAAVVPARRAAALDPAQAIRL
ncbi:MAG: ABC transporter permease [Rubrivivax sp.]|jgi:lipoprotein-releasing system permease protein|nr:ABC transporter permease [Rubrivivax sp.]